MTTTDPFSTESDRIIAEGLSAVEQLRAHIAAVELARDTQPERLARARQEAEDARDWAGIEEPWHQQVTTIESADGGAFVNLPNMIGKEVYGARLAFDVLDCGDDIARQNDVMHRYYSMVNGDTGIAMILMWSALTTIATAVVPTMLDEVETGASNYEARVLLADARTNAWSTRVGVLRAEEAANRCHDDDGSSEDAS